jgi:ParB-like chromosome segregation protein Spo0J
LLGARAGPARYSRGKGLAGASAVQAVGGATRLAAAKAEGWAWIDTQILEGDDIDFREAEIIENLHRAELTVLERAEWQAELARLCEETPAQVVQPSRPDREKRGDAQAARLLEPNPEKQNAKRVQIQRDKKIAAIAPGAKDAARASGLSDEKKALLKVAAEPTPEAQVAKVAEIAERKAAPEMTISRSPLRPRRSAYKKEAAGARKDAPLPPRCSRPRRNERPSYRQDRVPT